MFGLFKKRIAVTAAAPRHYEIAKESMEILRKTVNPATFFGRCDDVAASEKRITGRPSKFRKDLALQTRLQIDFFDRAVAAGKADLLRQVMPKYAGKLTPAARAYYQTLGL